MSLWSSDSMTTVLKNLVSGLSRHWTKLEKYWHVPNSASISEARQTVGSQVMSQFSLARVSPLATPDTAGAFLGGLRVMAIDRTLLDVPDSRANARAFGYSASSPGTTAAFFRALRLVLLLYKAHHYYKLNSAEVFSYGCGLATDTCVLQVAL